LREAVSLLWWAGVLALVLEDLGFSGFRCLSINAIAAKAVVLHQRGRP